MQLGSLFLKVHLNILFGIVPDSAGIGHKNGLEQTKKRQRYQIADKEIWFNAGKGKRAEKYRKKQIYHALLGKLRANLHDLLAIGGRGLFCAFELDIGLNKLDRVVGAGRNRLGRCQP